MFADVASGVGLDEDIEVAGSSVVGNGGVGTENLLVGDDLSLGVLDGQGGSQGDVLADGQTEDGGGARETEAVDGSVVREDNLVGQGELLESGGIEDFLDLCRNWSGLCQNCREREKVLTVVEELVASQSSSNGNGNRHQALVDQGSSDDQDCRRSIDALDVLRSEGPCGLVGVLRRHDELLKESN